MAGRRDSVETPAGGGDAVDGAIQKLYGELWANDDAAFEADLGRSLHPRSPDMLFDHFAALGVGPADTVLDAGCRDAVHAVELARRFGCRVVGVDPVPIHAESARAKVAAAGLADRIDIRAGRLEALPLQTGEIDHV